MLCPFTGTLTSLPFLTFCLPPQETLTSRSHMSPQKYLLESTSCLKIRIYLWMKSFPGFPRMGMRLPVGMCEKAGIQKWHLLLSTFLCFSRSGCHKTINLSNERTGADEEICGFCRLQDPLQGSYSMSSSKTILLCDCSPSVFYFISCAINTTENDITLPSFLWYMLSWKSSRKTVITR